MKWMIAILVLAATLVMYACRSKPSDIKNRTADEYFDEIKQVPATHEADDPAAPFKRIFTHFKTGATEENIRASYADEFYFNDTFKIIHDIDELVPYMQETAAQVEATDVEILDAVKSREDYYLRWRMTMRFTARGREINSVSIGMTQLRFNAQGKIIFHQDFWDGAEGFYQHLPYIGYWVRKVRDAL